MNRLSTHMTVAQTVTVFPQTRVIFERVGVNPSGEGKETLSEAAHSRSMSTSDLLDLLADGVLQTSMVKPVRDVLNMLASLRADHAHLRRILHCLEQGLTGEVHFSRRDYLSWLDLLESELWRHMEREERLLGKTLKRVLRREMKVYHNASEHEELEQALHAFREVLCEGGPAARKEIQPYGTHLIDMLREHMDTEEQMIYPVAEKELV